jgi:hypothetical protein
VLEFDWRLIVIDCERIRRWTFWFEDRMKRGGYQSKQSIVPEETQSYALNQPVKDLAR